MYYSSSDVYEYISKQTKDPIVKRKKCSISGTQFAISASDVEFYKKVSPTFAWEDFEIPFPSLCPEERQRRRMARRNERNLYKWVCHATGERIVCMYPPSSEFIVYKTDYRWSDKWTWLSYAQEIDLSVTFTAQFKQLLSKVPRMSLAKSDNDKCSYVNYTNYSKDCYLIYGNHESDSCMYGWRMHHCLWCVDCSQVSHCKYCFECLDCETCYRCTWSSACQECTDCDYCIWCTWCTHCLFCVEMNNASYCIFGVQYTKEEYEFEKSKLLSSLDESLEKFELYKEQKTVKVLNKRDSESSLWDNIIRCKDCVSVFSAQDCTNCMRIFLAEEATDCRDCDVVWRPSELCYEWMSTCVNAYKNCFSSFCRWCQEILYCDSCFYSQHLFWCVWLRNKSYCIFNKQYTKEEYMLLVPTLIQMMKSTWERGEFFHPSLSPFGYNLSVAQEYYPSSKDKALAWWYSWSDETPDPVIPVEIETIDSSMLPSIQDVEEWIVKKIIICQTSWRPYRIILQELQYYQKHNLELPRLHPDLRHLRRLSKRWAIHISLP